MTHASYTARLAALALGLILLVLALPASAAEIDEEAMKQFFQEHPEIILQILADRPELVFDIAQQGAIAKRKRLLQAQWETQYENPREPVLEKGRAIRGEADAPITIFEYSDFLCPYCARASLIMERVLAEYSGQVRLVFKHTPSKSHENSRLAARYFEAASMQDPQKAWRLNDAFFRNQVRLNEEGEDWILSVAKGVDLDLSKLVADAASPEVEERIERDLAEADKFEFNGSPTFLVNGVEYPGEPDWEDIVNLIQFIQDKMKD